MQDLGLSPDRETVRDLKAFHKKIGMLDGEPAFAAGSGSMVGEIFRKCETICYAQVAIA